jgi:hypothetical protein
LWDVGFADVALTDETRSAALENLPLADTALKIERFPLADSENLPEPTAGSTFVSFHHNAIREAVAERKPSPARTQGATRAPHASA